MSKKRLIPKLQMKSSERNSEKLVLVITKQFDRIIEIGDPVSQAKIFQDQGADDAEELVNILMGVTDHQKVQRCRAELVLGNEVPQEQHDVAVLSLRHGVVALNDEVPREISGLLDALVEDMLESLTPGF